MVKRLRGLSMSGLALRESSHMQQEPPIEGRGLCGARLSRLRNGGISSQGRTVILFAINTDAKCMDFANRRSIALVSVLVLNATRPLFTDTNSRIILPAAL